MLILKNLILLQEIFKMNTVSYYYEREERMNTQGVSFTFARAHFIGTKR